MSLSHGTILDMDYVVTFLLLEELRIKSLEIAISSSRLQTLVSREINNKRKDTNNNEKDKGKCKPNDDIRCYYYDKVDYIMKYYWKLTQD